MKITELGQFGLIDAVAKMIEEARDNEADSWKNLLVGIGDDCAIWRGESANQRQGGLPGPGRSFNLDIISGKTGWKALAVNSHSRHRRHPKLCPGLAGLASGHRGREFLSYIRNAKTNGFWGGSGWRQHGRLTRSFVDVAVPENRNPQGKYLSRSSSEGRWDRVTGWLGTAAAGLEMLKRKLRFSAATTDCLKNAFANPNQGC
jgi:thiamine monophosphate kinase